MTTTSPESVTPILITSANDAAHARLRMACRQTWIAGLRPEFRPLFVIGCPGQREAWSIEGDLLKVRCDDGYNHLPEKVRLALCAVMERFDFRWLFKCDDDTWINSWQFNGYPFWNWDQVGNFAWGEEGWASGAGYSLSRRAVYQVAQEMTCGITGPEDKIIGQIVREMPGARRHHESAILPFSKEQWQPCLLGHWIKTPEAMQAFHEAGVALYQTPAHERSQRAVGARPRYDGTTADPRPARRSPSRVRDKDGLVFVQMASYRDEDLLNTLRDLIAKAADPERLRFGICWQRAEGDSMEEFLDDPRFKIVDVPWQKSRGLGWARRITQYLYQDEAFTIQLDAHERFVQGWDARLIEMMNEVDSEKPIISYYPAPFTPGEPLEVPAKLSKIQASHFREDGILHVVGNGWVPADEAVQRPVRARFLAGGFLFTLGQHCREVQYDPHIYFADEVPMAARSYTHGYDLYHPHEHLAWHYYGRKEASKHWDDHSKDAKGQGAVDEVWWERESRGRLRSQQLLGIMDYGLPLGDHGLGRLRSLADYERYAGLSFRGRCLHDEARDGVPPPVAFTDSISRRQSMKVTVGP